MIKEFYLKKSLQLLEKYYSKYEEKKIPIYKYGLEGVYLTITKLLIIIALSIILGLFKEMLLFMIAYNLLRLFGFGLHASKSYICLIISTIIFIAIPYISTIIEINIYLKIIICTFCLISFILYAPADTEKRPIVSKKRRLTYKILSSSILLIYIIMIFVLKDNFVINILLFGMLTETFMIHPLSYKMFNMPYNNYIEYMKRKKAV
jgi:accessory gene regulator B